MQRKVRKYTTYIAKNRQRKVRNTASMPKTWHKNLVRNGIKGNASVKEFTNNVKNYEEYK